MKLSHRLWKLPVCFVLLCLAASSAKAQLQYESAAAEPFRAQWLLPNVALQPTNLELLKPEFPVSPVVDVFLRRVQLEWLPDTSGILITHPFALPNEPVPLRFQFVVAGRVVEQQLVLDERDMPRPKLLVSWGDTLWEIALAVRPDDDLTPQQVMLALQDLNPQAFLRDNINWVLSDRELRLPTRAEILSRTVPEAIAEVRRQNEAFYAWQRARAVQPEAASSAETVAPTAEAPIPPVADADAFLEVLGVPETAVEVLSAEPTMAGVQALRDELTLQREMRIALDRQMRVHQERLTALDAQLQTLTELVSLELAAAAQLQATADALVADSDLSSIWVPDSVEQPTAPDEQSNPTASQTPLLPTQTDPLPWVTDDDLDDGDTRPAAPAEISQADVLISEEANLSIAPAEDPAAESRARPASQPVMPNHIQWLQHGLWILGLVIVVWLSIIFWRWRQLSQAPMTASTTANAVAPQHPKPQSKPDTSSLDHQRESEPEPESNSDSLMVESSEDPVQVQLELAQVYAELGHAEAARDLLQQVMTAGSEEQIATAQALLKHLGSPS